MKPKRRVTRRLLTPRMASEFSGVPRATIARWIKDGTLKVQKTPGGHPRILWSDMETLMGSIGIEPTAPPEEED